MRFAIVGQNIPLDPVDGVNSPTATVAFIVDAPYDIYEFTSLTTNAPIKASINRTPTTHCNYPTDYILSATGVNATCKKYDNVITFTGVNNATNKQATCKFDNYFYQLRYAKQCILCANRLPPLYILHAFACAIHASLPTRTPPPLRARPPTLLGSPSHF